MKYKILKNLTFLVVLLLLISQPLVSAQDGNTLIIASGTDIENVDIHVVTSSPSYSVLGHIYETLFEMTPEGELVGLLAESITATSDNAYEIKLREGINFTDGTPFNAEAAKASLDRVLNVDNAAPYRFLLVVAGVPSEVEVLDEYTIQITTSIPFAPLPAHLTHGGLAMISPAAIAQGADYLATNAVGTGPFMLSSWDRAEQVTLVRNPDYWGEEPGVDTLVFRVIVEDGARIVEVESGTVDVAVRVPPADIPRLQANPNLDVVVTPGLRTIYVFFNVNAPPFDDVRVRQAVNYAVDKDAIVESLFEGAALASSAPFAPPIFGYAGQTPYTRDLDRARELLAEAGVEPGTSVVLYHPTGRYIQDALVADAIRAQLGEVGLNVELRTMEFTQYVPHVRKTVEDGNDVQFAMLGWGVPTVDADYALYSLFHSSQHPPGFNGAFYSNADVDRLLDEARSTLDTEERQAAYAEAIGIIWEEAPWLFLYSEIQVTAVRNNVNNFIVHPDESWLAHTASKD